MVTRKNSDKETKQTTKKISNPISIKAKIRNFFATYSGHLCFIIFIGISLLAYILPNRSAWIALMGNLISVIGIIALYCFTRNFTEIFIPFIQVETEQQAKEAKKIGLSSAEIKKVKKQVFKDAKLFFQEKQFFFNVILTVTGAIINGISDFF